MPLTHGPWDEMRLWLCASVEYQSSGEQQKKAECNSENLSTDPALSSPTAPPSILSVSHSWAYLRAAKFYDRPGHADQLHLELWWRGLNVAQDAGSYLYNADPPWDNALTHTAVHNTVMIDNRQQMTPAGRFLYLDRAEAQVLKRERVEDRSWERIAARHDGYQRLGVIHQRSVTAYQDHRWMIEDQLLPISSSMPPAPHSTRLHWLLPDWDFEILEDVFGVRIKSPYGWVELGVNLSPSAFILPPSSFRLQLVRAGDLLHGSGKISPTWGWISPTYGVKQPALSFSVTAICELPLTFTSEWKFPDE